jgi:hypothetical protein
MSAVLTPEEAAARRRRNVWIALAVAAFVVLVFLITLAKLQAGVLDRPL